MSSSIPNLPIRQLNGCRHFGPSDEYKDITPPMGSEIFLARIPQDFPHKELLKIVCSAGKVYDVRLMMTFVKSNKGYAFVRYFTPEEASVAMSRLNGFRVFSGGRFGHLVATPSTDHRILMLTGCCPGVTIEEVENVFREISGAELISVSAEFSKVDALPVFYLLFASHRGAALTKKSKWKLQVPKSWGIWVNLDWQPNKVKKAFSCLQSGSPTDMNGFHNPYARLGLQCMLPSTNAEAQPQPLSASALSNILRPNANNMDVSPAAQAFRFQRMPFSTNTVVASSMSNVLRPNADNMDFSASAPAFRVQQMPQSAGTRALPMTTSTLSNRLQANEDSMDWNAPAHVLTGVQQMTQSAGTRALPLTTSTLGNRLQANEDSMDWNAPAPAFRLPANPNPASNTGGLLQPAPMMWSRTAGSSLVNRFSPVFDRPKNPVFSNASLQPRSTSTLNQSWLPDPENLGNLGSLANLTVCEPISSNDMGQRTLNAESGSRHLRHYSHGINTAQGISNYTPGNQLSENNQNFSNSQIQESRSVEPAGAWGGTASQGYSQGDIQRRCVGGEMPSTSRQNLTFGAGGTSRPLGTSPLLYENDDLMDENSHPLLEEPQQFSLFSRPIRARVNKDQEHMKTMRF